MKQKLVTRSSTEAEIVGVHDVMPQLIWTAHFLRGQGVVVDESILYQDNTSSILIEKNGRSSCTKRTWHMNIRYFFIKDEVDAKRVRIEHCRTDVMLADFFTKPLQGAPFKKLRDEIMNIDPSSAYHSSNSVHRSVLSVKADVVGVKTCQDDVRDIKDMSVTSPRRSYKDVLLGERGERSLKEVLLSELHKTRRNNSDNSLERSVKP
jgi:hypothetical protein